MEEEVVAHRDQDVHVGLVDQTLGSGLDFTHGAGFDSTWYMPESVGSGVALLDYDGDGDLDAYVIDVAGDGPLRNRLFRNDGHARFTDVTGASGAGDPGSRAGCGRWGCATPPAAGGVAWRWPA